MEKSKKSKIDNEENNDDEKKYSKNKNSSEDKGEKYFPMWKRFLISITDIDQYYLLVGEGLHRNFTYLVSLIAILNLIITIAFVSETKRAFENSADFIEKNIADFTITKEELILKNESKPIVAKLNRARELKIILNDESSENDNNDEIERCKEDIIIFGKNNVYIKIKNFNRTYSYNKLMNFLQFDKISKSDIVGLANNKQEVNKIFRIMFLILLIYFFIEFFMTIFIYIVSVMLIGIIVSRCLYLKLKVRIVFCMAVASITLSIVLAAIYVLCFIYTGFIMDYFSLMFSIIAYVYMTMSLIDIYLNLVEV